MTGSSGKRQHILFWRNARVLETSKDIFSDAWDRCQGLLKDWFPIYSKIRGDLLDVPKGGYSRILKQDTKGGKTL